LKKKEKLTRPAGWVPAEQAEKVHRMPHTYNTRYQKKVTMEAHPLYQQFLTMDFKTLCQQIKFINAQPYWYRDDDVLRYADHALDILRAKNDSRNTALMLRFMGVHEEASRQQRLLWCEEQVRIVKEQNEAMFARLAAKYDGFWRTNADGSRTLVVPPTESVSTQTDDAFVGEPVPVE
jgi:hypothetical protein